MQVRFLPGASAEGTARRPGIAEPPAQNRSRAWDQSRPLAARASLGDRHRGSCYRPPLLVSESTLEAPPIRESASQPLFTVPFALAGHYALWLWMIAVVSISLASESLCVEE